MWRYAAGQATGSSHEKLKRPPQDRLHCAVLEREATLIAVVADGAGSADYSQYGAEIAVTAVGDIARLGVRAGRVDLDEMLREAASIARERITEAAAERNVTVRDLACTLLAVVVTPGGGAALQIGDGAIVIGSSSPGWRWVFWPQKGEYANTTLFLTDAAAMANAEVVQLPPDVQDVAVFTDGLEALALHYASRCAHEPFFRGTFQPLYACTAAGEAAELSQSLAQMLASPAVRARTDDDTSLILATRREPAP
jgi:hypothetical protein